MRIRSLDLETTGLKTDETPRQGIVEIGYSDVVLVEPGKYRVEHGFGMLVNPGMPCSIEARAVHHIPQSEIYAKGVSPDAACAELMRGEIDYFCAHNRDHEIEFFGGGETPWLCTYKCGVRIWPDAPGHKLQELRYFLEIDDEADFDPALASRPHRAPDDAYVGAFVLRRLLVDAAAQNVDVDALVRWSNGPALLQMCFMKKHKGTLWKDVPTDYMRWIVDKSDVKNRDILATVRYHLRQRGEQK